MLALVPGTACGLPSAAQAAPVDLLTKANLRIDGAAANDVSGVAELLDA